MKYTEIKYKYNNNTYSVLVKEYDYKTGDIGYYEGVVNEIESLTRAGAVIIDVYMCNNR